MKIKFASLLLLLCIFQIVAKAQKSTFEPGYIITETDTVNGLILRVDEVHLGREIRFRANVSGQLNTFTPETIKGFGFTEDNFFFRSVPVKIRNSDTVITLQRF